MGKYIKYTKVYLLITCNKTRVQLAKRVLSIHLSQSNKNLCNKERMLWWVWAVCSAMSHSSCQVKETFTLLSPLLFSSIFYALSLSLVPLQKEAWTWTSNFQVYVKLLRNGLLCVSLLSCFSYIYTKLYNLICL